MNSFRPQDASPIFLNRGTLEKVEGLMVGDPVRQGDRPTAAYCLGLPADWNYDIATESDTSFAGQMNTVCETPEAIQPDITMPPDVFLVTANSAIPVADSIKGYFDASGKEQPTITYINAGRKLQSGLLSFMAAHDTLSVELCKEETERLEPLVGGASHACVIDQFAVSGKTIDTTLGVLKAAGVQHVTGIRGRWYNQAHRTMISKKFLTSAYGQKMRTIGVHAYEQTHQ